MTLPEKITTLTESMRIGFDGMVSRHQSELAHKKDGVIFLNHSLQPPLHFTLRCLVLL